MTGRDGRKPCDHSIAQVGERKVVGEAVELIGKWFSLFVNAVAVIFLNRLELN